MGIWCDIQSHPTRPHPFPLPLPHPKPRPHIFNTFVPAKRTNQVADLQEQLFSLFFLDSSIIALNRFLGRRMSNCARVSQKWRKSSPKIHTYDVFLLRITVLPIHQPTVHSSMCCSLFVSVALTYMSVLSANRQHPQILGTHGSDKWKYNMWTWSNGCGLLRSDWISHQKLTSFSFQRYI